MYWKISACKNLMNVTVHRSERKTVIFSGFKASIVHPPITISNMEIKSSLSLGEKSFFPI